MSTYPDESLPYGLRPGRSRRGAGQRDTAISYVVLFGRNAISALLSGLSYNHDRYRFHLGVLVICCLAVPVCSVCLGNAEKPQGQQPTNRCPRAVPPCPAGGVVGHLSPQFSRVIGAACMRRGCGISCRSPITFQPHTRGTPDGVGLLSRTATPRWAAVDTNTGGDGWTVHAADPPYAGGVSIVPGRQIGMQTGQRHFRRLSPSPCQPLHP